MDEVFKALADASRRRLLDGLNARNGQSLRELCAGLDMARQSVSKHLAVLEAANLITIVWQGREKLHHLNPAPINAIADRWINQYDRARVHALADLKSALESEPMGNPEFVYTTYINATPERVWQAITEPAFARNYLGFALESDWQVGSTYSWNQNGIRIEHPDQVILEARPPRRLSFTFHTFVPELTAISTLTPEFIEQASVERRSKVTFDIETVGEQVKLTVLHDDFDADSVVLPRISEGWPMIMSNLKTGVEKTA